MLYPIELWVHAVGRQAGHPSFPTLAVKADRAGEPALRGTCKCFDCIELGGAAIAALTLGGATCIHRELGGLDKCKYGGTLELAGTSIFPAPCPTLVDGSSPYSPNDSSSASTADDSAARDVEAALAHPRRPALWRIGVATLVLFASFFVVEPLITLSIQKQPRRALPVQPGWSLVVQQRSLEALTCAWFFMLGASLGSFVHCLEYRWPRGISVVARGSACPGCGKAIRLWHNIPVFGWLYLGGRCARCGWEIPARYAITELLLGLMFVLLLALELIGGGLNLPGPYLSRFLGVTENIWDPNWRLIGIFAFHAALLTFLTTLSLFAWDRFGIAPAFAAIALAVGLLCPMAWPDLQVVKWNEVTALADSRLRTVIGQIAGTTAGLLLGNCLVRRTPGNIRAGDVGATLLGMLLVGLSLGWQAALAVAAMTVVLRAFLSFTPARTWPVAASIVVATLVHLLAWRWLRELPIYPGLQHLWATVVAVVAVPVAAGYVDSIERGGDAGPTIVDPPRAEEIPLTAVTTLPEEGVSP